MATNNIHWRDKLSCSDRTKRKYKIVYLSENENGTLDGTDKMTRKEYAMAQKFMRMTMHDKAKGLLFARSQAAVANRVKAGLIKEEQQFGVWVVWEEKGERSESLNGKRTED